VLTDRERLARQRARPLLVELHHALTRLTSTLTVMNTGAHPDDDHSRMLAAQRFRHGMRVVIACSTRGEGGQNSLGPERGGALGVVRTRELEEAARVLDADLAWLGFGPDDPVHDFGFSKNGVDTLARWGREGLLERLVRAYRRERPDIVIPTFLDVPGQHGHHRAMTEAAEAAIALAADPKAFPEHAAEGLTPWRVEKFYLPAWPGGGGTYDDEVPPPNATVLVDAAGRDAATGAAFADIGQWSRSYHASQGMGHWRPVPQTSWALHLKSGGGDSEHSVADGLPADLRDLGATLGGAAAAALAEAQDRIDDALAAFPDREPIIVALTAAASALERAAAALEDGQREAVKHRLERKQREIDVALLLAAGIRGSAWLAPAAVAPGGGAELSVHVDAEVQVTVRPVAEAALAIGDRLSRDGIERYAVQAAADAPLTSPFRETFASSGGNGLLAVELSAEIGGRVARMVIDLDEAAMIVPPRSVSVDPDAVLLPLPVSSDPVAVTLRSDHPGAVTLAETAGFSVTVDDDRATITAAPGLAAGRYRLPVLSDGVAGYRSTPIAYPHIGRTSALAPAALDVLALELALPTGARIGYVGGGADHVGTWLQRMELPVDLLDSDALTGDFSRYTTIVVGIFSFGLRPDLAAATTRLHDWVRAGGHLVTLYHRPSDGWTPDRTPPARLKIGSPSLRWRVTDPAAAVTVLAPSHPLLNGPNRIGPDDWAGWDKERGLYFAAEWDPAYVPLLSMHDRGEAPLTGALLSAEIGKGRHTHTSLVLHHQMDRLVPGAFRLMANLVQPA
jgi:LmbE family N-acetylglucosaminyl deacetylase